MPHRVLIVDDEGAILSTFSEILKLQGFAVDTASSAKAAKMALAMGTFDAVITDLKMETPTAGFDVVDAAKKQVSRPATIIMSAYPEFGSQWKQRGAHAFFEKPASMAELLRKLEELLNGRIHAIAA